MMINYCLLVIFVFEVLYQRDHVHVTVVSVNTIRYLRQKYNEADTNTLHIIISTRSCRWSLAESHYRIAA